MSTLIVVDDNDIDRLIIKYSLIKYPVFDYILYYDEGLSLIKYLKDHKSDHVNLPDAIFLDLRMPNYDGWAVLEALKAIYHKLHKDITVYIISASISSQDRFRALKYSFVHQFISKPLTRDILISISRDMINRTVYLFLCLLHLIAISVCGHRNSFIHLNQNQK